MTGWWLTYPSEKYESQLGLLFKYGKKHVPKHQPVMINPSSTLVPSLGDWLDVHSLKGYI
jgi:hypothetical protein